MTKFKYFSSFDELTWSVDDYISIVRANIGWTLRSEVRQWINDCCSGSVSIWNGTSTPDPGQNGNWGNLIAPDKSVTYILFSNNEDAEMFLLKYSGKIDTKYYGGDLTKVWHDSRA